MKRMGLLGSRWLRRCPGLLDFVHRVVAVLCGPHRRARRSKTLQDHTSEVGTQDLCAARSDCRLLPRSCTGSVAVVSQRRWTAPLCCVHATLFHWVRRLSEASPSPQRRLFGRAAHAHGGERLAVANSVALPTLARRMAAAGCPHPVILRLSNGCRATNHVKSGQSGDHRLPE